MATVGLIGGLTNGLINKQGGCAAADLRDYTVEACISAAVSFHMTAILDPKVRFVVPTWWVVRTLANAGSTCRLSWPESGKHIDPIVF
jgi:hypothetical protein